jgi:ferritin-like metal-binding protein YciE
MKFDSLEQLYLTELQDLYDAEKQLLKALPQLARKVSSTKLAQAFERHARQTQEQAKRLERIFREHELKSKGRRCPAMAGLIAEANETAREPLSEELIDLGLITAAQKVEHYEISGYMSALSLGRSLGLRSDIQLLERTLREEEETDEKLSKLSQVLLQKHDKQGERAASKREMRRPQRSRTAAGRSARTRRAGQTRKSARGRTSRGGAAK